MIYLDNSATTKPYQEVLDTFLKVNESYYANPSSIHSFGGQVEKLIQQSREQVASLLGIKKKEVFFTSGGTESNNLAIKGTAMQYGNRGKHIITTNIEHPSVINGVKQLESLGFSVTYLDGDEQGRICPEELKAALRDDTILVSVMWVNNEIGSIQPIMEIGKILKGYPKVVFHVDAVQAVGKIPLALDLIDTCSISAHKIHGLKGTGMLYVRDGLRLSPLLSGGEQEGNLRSGTENTGGIVSFAKALRIHLAESEEKLAIMEENHLFLRQELEAIDGVTVHTPANFHAPHILNFSVQDFKGEVLIHALDRRDVFVSTTSACSSKQNKPSRTLLSMGVSEDLANSSIRVSLSFHNTMDECRAFIRVLNEEIDNLQHTMRRSR
ncbi:cysteine desulfurase family protein [Bacillus sp. KH172YL63]|uniref:cysteine desulfurase family protein n=1 Tax=Bacillus sp. KH172YL63 TaxID=2709784 RepID=UPI0013E47AE3|nr:cysteine desulfurase family protein [Bacillus sp. KH172YL63]BCB05262.1 aminotransferase V [Bacillus sp. KH172YL63]